MQVTRILLLLSAILFAGCSAAPPQAMFKGNLSQCEVMLRDFYLDVEKHRDFSLPYHQDQRFPHLAFDRFSASLTSELTDVPSRAQWLAYVSEKGKHQLATAIALTPSSSPQSLLTCQQALSEQSMENGRMWRALAEQPPQVATAYQHWKRVAGIYPVARLVAKGQIENEQARIKDQSGRELAAPFTYGDVSSQQMSSVRIAAIFNNAKQYSSLNWPLLTSPESDALLDHYSPLFDVETLSADDLPGALALDSRGNPFIDTTQPSLYRDLSYTRFNGAILPQLNYTLWFPARTAKGDFDPYAGPFDAVKIRITFDEKGAPFILDTIHQCGCYHMVYALNPTLTFIQRDDEMPIQNTLPPPSPQETFLISLTAGEHMISDIAVTNNTSTDIALVPQSALSIMTLKTPAGVTKSPFGDEGILKQSARGERWFLWPFGVRSPGAMRQDGHHAIAFIGERHFDDAFLFEQLLEQN